MSAIDNILERLKKYPSIAYSVEGSKITVRPAEDQSFPVSLSVDGDEYTICFGDWHDHFETEEEALEFFAFGLSDSCRLKVISRGGHPYKWIVENLTDGTWRVLYETGLLFFRFWCKKEETIFQNRIIRK